MALSSADIQNLVHNPSVASRAIIAAKVAKDFTKSSFTERENALALEIFRLLLRDTARMVRKAMAEELKESPLVPRDIVLALAQDENDIACGVLTHSPVLQEQDLLAIVRSSRSVQKWLGISKRKQLPANVSHALIHTGNTQVLQEILSNEEAQIFAQDLERIAKLYHKEQHILEVLVSRGDLDPLVAEKIYHQATEQLQAQLTKKPALFSTATLHQATQIARDIAIVKFLTPWLTLRDMERLVGQMYRNGRLHYALALRALCAGEIAFFEISMARLAGITVENTRILLQDAGKLGCEALFETARIPSSFIGAVHLIYRMAVEEMPQGRDSLPQFGQRMIDRIHTKNYHQTIENMGYFLSMLRQHHGTKAATLS